MMTADASKNLRIELDEVMETDANVEHNIL